MDLRKAQNTHPQILWIINWYVFAGVNLPPAEEVSEIVGDAAGVEVEEELEAAEEELVAVKEELVAVEEELLVVVEAVKMQHNLVESECSNHTI